MTKVPTQILGIGTDIIEIERIAKSIKEHRNRFLDHLFTEQEQRYALSFHHSEITFAGRFAAKEAISKAFGTGIGEVIQWKDMEVLNAPSGKPYVILAPHLLSHFGNPKVEISISHSKSHAIAFAIVTI